MATIGDLVLVYREEHPAFFARIEDISADSKPDWYQVTFLILEIPLTETVWMLREAYISGEPFTMNGVRLRLERVQGPQEQRLQSISPASGSQEGQPTERGKIISLFDRKRR